nr:ribonuclease H-like domain-containing protein [Tanacetum cinerariifolium]
FGVDAIEDFKEYMLRDYYCWLKTYCCCLKDKDLQASKDPHYTRTFMPPKPDLVFHDASTVSEIVPTVINVKPNPSQSWLGSPKDTKLLFDVQGNLQQDLKDKGLPDENHVLLRVPREKNMYNVDLKNIVPLGDLTCLFAKAILDKSNLWHRRLGHINFKTMNKLVKGNLVRGLPSKVFENNHTYVACKKGKQHRASCKTKPVSSLQSVIRTTVKTANVVREMVSIVSDVRYRTRSRPTWLFDIDTLTQSMNYQPVVVGNQPNSSAGIQEHLDAEFSVNSTNGVNAASAPVTAVGLNLTNSTNSFNDAGPSDKALSLTFEINVKSLFVDPSQYPDDPNMHALEDIVNSDDEEDVGIEADFSNLETSITVSPIPKTKVHKDHPVT